MLITIIASVSHAFISFFYSPSPSSLRTLISSFLPNKLSLRSSFLPFSSFSRWRHHLHSQPTASVSANTTNASSQKLENPDDLIDYVETFIFDCDGVVWKGDKLIDEI